MREAEEEDLLKATRAAPVVDPITWRKSSPNKLETIHRCPIGIKWLLLLFMLIVLVAQFAMPREKEPDAGNIADEDVIDDENGLPLEDDRPQSTWSVENSPKTKATEGKTGDTAVVDDENDVPLVDDWPQSIWPISEKALTSVMAMVHGEGHSGPPTCDKQTSKGQIRMAAYGSGFGATIMNMVANSIYAHFTKRRFLLVSREYRSYDPERSTEKINQPNVIGALYEREFAFPKESTVCMNWTTACPDEGDRDCRGASTSPVKPVVTSFNRLMNRLMAEQFGTYMRLRTELIRFFTRMKLPLRQSVDDRLEEFLPLDLFHKGKNGDVNDESEQGMTIGIHLRRGDKYREAPPTPAIEYVRAGIKAWRISKPLQDVRKVIIATDDAMAAEEIAAEWNRTLVRNAQEYGLFQPKEGFAIRAVAAQPSNRPDLLVSLDEETLRLARQGLVDLLVDLKLLVMSDVFIGTQSSNFGLLVCYMRGGRMCFNAESYKNLDEPFIWDHSQDKMK